MKYSQDEILKAVQLIKDICIDAYECESCPFGSDEGCLIIDAHPCDWHVHSKEHWKALV